MKILILLLTFCLALPVEASEPYRDIKWEELVPKGWDPAKDLKGLDFATLSDSDPRAMEALEKLRRLWDEAPTEPALNGRRIRIPGFVIPLERKGEQVLEFLLVPYFGACIHTPPPPANQIVHAVSAKPLGKMQTMDTVWVTGTLGLQRAETQWGHAGYRLSVDKVTPYEAPKGKK